MKKKDFLTLFEDVIEAGRDTLTGDENINELDGWDSLAIVSFIAVVDETIGVTLSPQGIAESKTVQDLIDLLGDTIAE
jgi:acyl carrier protein